MERGAFRLVTLRTGARAVQHLGHGEVMHPSMGPWAEAQRLYVEGTKLQAHLVAPVPPCSSARPLVVWDVGLGAGTNAAAVLSCARGLPAHARRPLWLCSFERDLDALFLALEDASGFSYLQPWAEAARTLARTGRYEEEGLVWQLWHGELEQVLGEAGFGRGVVPSPPVAPSPASPPPAELVLYDPFSPKANPALWTRAALGQVLRVSAPSPEHSSLLVTYSAATRTRVSLLLAGYCVGVGPSTGNKGETTVAATRLDLLEAPLGTRWLERWERSTARAPHGEELTPALEAQIRAHPQFASVQGHAHGDEGVR